MEPIFFVMVAGLAVLGIVVAVLAYKAEQARRRELRDLAASMGWSFDESEDPGHDEEYGAFAAFRKGHSRAAYNTMRGEVEIAGRRYRVKAGDYLYKVTSSNGKTTTTHTYRLSYLILHLPFAAAPNLVIRPEGVLDKVAGVLGFDDIDFESEAFSRRFHVASSDKRFAYDVVTPAMMEFLMGAPGPPVDLRRGRLCLTDGRTRWSAPQFRGVVGWAERFLSLWPEHVTRILEAGTVRTDG